MKTLSKYKDQKCIFAFLELASFWGCFPDIR